MFKYMLGILTLLNSQANLPQFIHKSFTAELIYELSREGGTISSFSSSLDGDTSPFSYWLNRASIKYLRPRCLPRITCVCMKDAAAHQRLVWMNNSAIHGCLSTYQYVVD